MQEMNGAKKGNARVNTFCFSPSLPPVRRVSAGACVRFFCLVTKNKKQKASRAQKGYKTNKRKEGSHGGCCYIASAALRAPVGVVASPPVGPLFFLFVYRSGRKTPMLWGTPGAVW